MCSLQHYGLAKWLIRSKKSTRNKMQYGLYLGFCIFCVVGGCFLVQFFLGTDRYHAPMEDIHYTEGPCVMDEYHPSSVIEELDFYSLRYDEIVSKEEAVLAGADVLRYLDSKGLNRRDLEVASVVYCKEEKVWAVFCYPKDWTNDTTGTAFVIVFRDGTGELLGTFLN